MGGLNSPGISYRISREYLRHSCDEVCQSYGLHCSTENHGLTDHNIPGIMAKLLGQPCRHGFTTTDSYRLIGPAYINASNNWQGRCYGWKSIPDIFNCGRRPSKRTTRRMCPCTQGNSYVSPFSTDFFNMFSKSCLECQSVTIIIYFRKLMPCATLILL